ncbi:MAG TPA: thermonuclease family protein [Allocoleopsis sp.]
MAIPLYQQWQHYQTNRPDYDNPNPSPKTSLAPPSGQSESWQVVRVTDGDTIVVRSGGREERIRFCGIDAPEIQHGSKAGQPLGEQSQAYLQQLIEETNGTVVLMETDRDRYGRLVAEVFTVKADGEEKSLQDEMLMAGMAYVYPQYVSSCPNEQPMRLAEAVAQQHHVGVWSGEYQRPWEFRHANR